MASILSAAQAGFNQSHQGGIRSAAVQGSDSQSIFAKALSVLDYTSLPSLKGADKTTVVFTILAIVATFLLTEQYVYQRKKAGLPGPKWTIPVIGKFADSLHPSLEKYQAGWNSGPLSVASVFNM